MAESLDARRRETLEARGWRCERCGHEGTPNGEGRFSGLEVHHKNGDHLHDHRDENLEVLCRPCHGKLHGHRLPKATLSRTGRRRGLVLATYPARVPVYDTRKGLELWRRIARRRGVSVTALGRILLREEAERLGLPVPENGDEKGGAG